MVKNAQWAQQPFSKRSFQNFFFYHNLISCHGKKVTWLLWHARSEAFYYMGCVHLLTTIGLDEHSLSFALVSFMAKFLSFPYFLSLAWFCLLSQFCLVSMFSF